MLVKKCEICGSSLGAGLTIFLMLGSKCRCEQCGSQFRKSQIWMFVLSIIIVIVTIASLGLLNVFGAYGFIFIATIPLILFLIGSYIVPLDRVE